MIIVTSEDQLKKDAIANCISCLIADKLKLCKICEFKIGLPEREKFFSTFKKEEIK